MVDIENPHEIRDVIREYQDDLRSLLQNASLVMTIYLIVMVADGVILHLASEAVSGNRTYNLGVVIEIGFVFGAIALMALIAREYQRLQRAIAAFTELYLETDFFRDVLLIPIEIELTKELIENRYQVFLQRSQRAPIFAPEFFQV